MAVGKKKVTAFVGSAQRGGATYRVARQFLDDLEAFGDVQGEIVFLSDYDVRVCRGCKACFARGGDKCPLKDDRDVIVGKMLASDGVVFASPNYTWQVSGITKVLLDRLGYMCGNTSLFVELNWSRRAPAGRPAWRHSYLWSMR